MITTNLGFADWTQVFGDPVMTAALLDRLTHKAHIINCNWESYRLKQSLNEKGKRAEQGHTSMETTVYNPQKGRLETIDVEFTKDNTTWFRQLPQCSMTFT